VSISVSARGPNVSLITIDNPGKANAMSRATSADLAEAWAQLDADPLCCAIVITGAGDRAFTAGADVSGDLSASEEGAAAKLVHQIGYVQAMKLLLTAGGIDADEAVRIGLVNEVVPADEVMTRALGTAEAIAANSPKAVQAVKRFVSTGFAEQSRQREPFAQALGDAVRASADFTEGVTAFPSAASPTTSRSPAVPAPLRRALG
jgi:enoyl-CoA hydratase/carnithine racemase